MLHAVAVAQACLKSIESCGCKQLEIARVSTIHSAGMTFKPDCWVVYTDIAGSCELVYLSSILQIKQASIDGTMAHHVKIFRFSFKQLGVVREANRLLVDAARFQSLLDTPQSSSWTAAASDFAASRCPLRGRWIWTPTVFEQWACSGLCRAVHLCNISTTLNQLVFVFR